MESTFDKIRQWATDRNLIDGATPAAQFQKLGEEFGELGRALVEGNLDMTQDAIGDMIVVLTIMSTQLGTSVENCIDGAYEEIKARKGKMVSGIFVKEA